MTHSFRTNLLGCAIALAAMPALAAGSYSPNAADDFPRRVLTSAIWYTPSD